MFNTLSRLIRTTNYFRLPFPGDTHADWNKEWFHFCIVTPEIEVIVNFNICADTRPAAPSGSHVARFIILTYENHAWDGDVDTIPMRDVHISSGQIDIHFGHNSVYYEQDEFVLSAALQNRPITLSLRLKPIALPLVMRGNTPISVGSINWVVVPRLAATGIVTVDHRVYPLVDAPTYHDHNWGKWLWGHDFAWEWGFALSENEDAAWSVVFDRTTNRARSRTMELTLALWKDAEIFRVFTQREISIHPSGYLTLERLPKFPRVMALVAPETTTDIPRYFDIRARANGDHLDCRFEAQHVTQIVIPNDTDLGVTIINEVSGQLEVRGRVKGQTVDMQGRGIFEFLTG